MIRDRAADHPFGQGVGPEYIVLRLADEAVAGSAEHGDLDASDLHSVGGRPDEQNRGQYTEKAPDSVQTPPGLQETASLIRLSVTPRVEKLVIRRADDDERKRDDRQNEHGR
jgi:hypothetical protein